MSTEIKNESSIEKSANETTVNVEANVQSNVETTKKRRGRGITNELRAVTRKKFDERTDCNRSNFLFLGHLDEIAIGWATLKDDVQGLPSFAGLSIPYLTFTFTSNHENVNDRKYYTHRILPAESNVETIPGAKSAWKVDNIFRFMKHIYDVFVLKGRDLSTEEEDMLTLPFEDFDDDMQYIPVDAEEVINGYKIVFENFIKLLNNNGKPAYKNDKGGILRIWIKLLRFTKRDGVWYPVVGGKSTFGDLGISNFINDGVIELYKENSAPSLKVDPNKESIIYQKSAEKAKTPTIGMPGIGVVPGTQMSGAGIDPVNNPAGGFNSNNSFDVFSGGADAAGAFVNPTEDLPF